MVDNRNLGNSIGNSGVSLSLVRKLLHRNARPAVGKIFSKAYPVEVARIVSALGGYERLQAFSILQEECDAEHVASVISEMDSSISISLLDRLEPKQLANQIGRAHV